MSVLSARLGPEAKVRSTQRSVAPGSDAEDIGTICKDGIEGDDADDANDHRARHRLSDVGCATAGVQPDLASR